MRYLPQVSEDGLTFSGQIDQNSPLPPGGASDLVREFIEDTVEMYIGETEILSMLIQKDLGPRNNVRIQMKWLDDTGEHWWEGLELNSYAAATAKILENQWREYNSLSMVILISIRDNPIVRVSVTRSPSEKVIVPTPGILSLRGELYTTRLIPEDNAERLFSGMDSTLEDLIDGGHGLQPVSNGANQNIDISSTWLAIRLWATNSQDWPTFFLKDVKEVLTSLRQYLDQRDQYCLVWFEVYIEHRGRQLKVGEVHVVDLRGLPKDARHLGTGGKSSFQDLSNSSQPLLKGANNITLHGELNAKEFSSTE